MTDSAPITTELVDRCLCGEDQAWEELLRRYSPRVLRACRKFARTSAEAGELCQEVFLKVFRTLRTFRRNEVTFDIWLAVLTRNLLTDHYRRTRRERLEVELHTESSARQPVCVRENPYNYSARREKARVVSRAMAKLPPAIEVAVRLRYLHAERQSDIAEKVGVPDGTVKSRLNRGRWMLERLLYPYRTA